MDSSPPKISLINNEGIAGALSEGDEPIFRNEMEKNEKSNIICILARKKNDIWIDFLKRIKKYKVYYVIDDEENELPEEGVNIIQINEKECRSCNYYNSSTASNLKPVVSWDKALYYFNRIIPNFEEKNVWFLEDDVFIMNEDILSQIDEESNEADLVCAFHEVNENGDIHKGWNHWVNVIHKIGTPWAHSLISCCRLSKRLLQKVDEYVSDRPLMFIEALFNTLAHHNNYKIHNPEKMKKITYNSEWKIEDVLKSPNFIYHPIKNTEIHSIIRKNKWRIVSNKAVRLECTRININEKVKIISSKYVVFDHETFFMKMASMNDEKVLEGILVSSEKISDLGYGGVFEYKVKITDDETMIFSTNSLSTYYFLLE